MNKLPLELEKKRNALTPDYIKVAEGKTHCRGCYDNGFNACFEIMSEDIYKLITIALYCPNTNSNYEAKINEIKAKYLEQRESK